MIDIKGFRTCYNKKTLDGGITNENIPDQQLAEKLHKPIKVIFGVLILQTCN